MNMDRARTLRKNQTQAEQVVWQLLRNRRLLGYKFRRQVPLGPYIVDFACIERKIIIELDGGQHADRIEHDTQRDTFLANYGYRVMRYWNNDVMENLPAVLQSIAQELSNQTKV